MTINQLSLQTKSTMELLNKDQKSVYDEYMEKIPDSVSLNLYLGFGKTLLSLAIGLENKRRSRHNSPILVVMSKTLLQSWVLEIEKFFGKESEFRKKAGLKCIKYVVYHQSAMKKINEYVFPRDKGGKIDLDVVLTTVDVVTKMYKSGNIEDMFIRREIVNPGQFGEHTIVHYNVPNIPYLKRGSILYNHRWGTMIIDEIQGYTSIGSLRCRGLASICADRRIATSGTVFSEPKVERILGYYMIMNSSYFPRNLPETKRYIKTTFGGYKKDMISREEPVKTESFKIKSKIISHQLSDDEQKVYLLLKQTIRDINKLYRKYMTRNDKDNARRFASYLLASITYLRQAVICPLVPVTKAAVDTANFSCKSKMSKIMMENFKDKGLEPYLNNPNSCRSSRINSIIETLAKHPAEKVVLFTSFRTSLTMINLYITNRETFTIDSSMSIDKRQLLLKEFAESENGVLLLSFKIGAEGLNLQSASVVLLCDLWWNSSTTAQAIGRVARQGQRSKEVNVYYFTSNTGIEDCVFEKHSDKNRVLDELAVGHKKTAVKSMSTMKIMKMIDLIDNQKKLASICI